MSTRGFVSHIDLNVADPPAEHDHAPGCDALALDDPSGIRIKVVHDPSTNP